MAQITFIDSARIRFHQSLHLRSRQIDCHRFLLVDSGVGGFRFPDATLAIHGGMLLPLSPGERESRYRAEEEVSYLYVEFESDSPLIDAPYCSSRLHPRTSRRFVR